MWSLERLLIARHRQLIIEVESPIGAKQTNNQKHMTRNDQW